MKIPAALREFVRRTAVHSASPGLEILTRRIMTLYGDAVQAVLYYGSCLRTGDELEGMADLYIIVDTYFNAYKRLLPAFFNRLLPPNVYYAETGSAMGMIRAKYAILTLDDFQIGTTRWFHSYLWGRFSQPCAVVYARSTEVEMRVTDCLAGAVMTFLARTVPCMPETFSAEQLWRTGFILSYRAELRSEKPDRAAGLYNFQPEYYEKAMRAGIPGLPWPVETVSDNRNPEALTFKADVSIPAGLSCRLAWTARILQGKLLSIMRLAKAGFTFSGGIDYILWKVERHSGIRVEVTPAMRRFPLLAALVLTWKLYRRGGFR